MAYGNWPFSSRTKTSIRPISETLRKREKREQQHLTEASSTRQQNRKRKELSETFCRLPPVPGSPALLQFTFHSPQQSRFQSQAFPLSPAHPRVPAQAGARRSLPVPGALLDTHVPLGETPSPLPRSHPRHLVTVCTMTRFLCGLFAFFSQTREREREGAKYPVCFGEEPPTPQPYLLDLLGRLCAVGRGKVGFGVCYSFFPPPPPREANNWPLDGICCRLGKALRGC